VKEKMREMKYNITLRISNALKRIGNFSDKYGTRVWSQVTPRKLMTLGWVGTIICDFILGSLELGMFFQGVFWTALGLFYHEKYMRK
jgi:hypothetical protein